MESAMNKINIAISKDLYDKIQQRVNMFGDEFKSVEEYVAFVLEEVVKEEQGMAYTQEEEEEIKNRLKSLGYI
jgi:Arc/MetJ-type ribon-helix-helix transcriptional regulator